MIKAGDVVQYGGGRYNVLAADGLQDSMTFGALSRSTIQDVAYPHRVLAVKTVELKPYVEPLAEWETPLLEDSDVTQNDWTEFWDSEDDDDNEWDDYDDFDEPDDDIDYVNQPPHYTQYNGFEVIDIVEQLDYLRGTAVKYIMRAGSKWDEIEDIKKAIWYLERKLTNLETGA